ncbi:MAG: hypothetical protein NWF04_09060 [Candidatus Bathyarchaeota archaeon]|nr:hypothetical protein [Candidatus Bathyarchaeota archaeon]
MAGTAKRKTSSRTRRRTKKDTPTATAVAPSAAAKVEEPFKVRVRRSRNEPEPTTLFTQKDIKRFVTEFVASWLRGDIIIRFPTAAELSKQTPLSMAVPFPKDPSVNAELKIKEHYIDLLSICAGTKPATTQEQEKAISDVFKMIMMFRSANRIEGKILSNDLQTKVTNLQQEINHLQEKTQTTTKLVEQITAHLFKNEKPPK